VKLRWFSVNVGTFANRTEANGNILSRQVVLVALPGVDLEAVQGEVKRQCDALPRGDIARQALSHSCVVRVDSKVLFDVASKRSMQTLIKIMGKANSAAMGRHRAAGALAQLRCVRRPQGVVRPRNRREPCESETHRRALLRGLSHGVESEVHNGGRELSLLVFLFRSSVESFVLHVMCCQGAPARLELMESIARRNAPLCCPWILFYKPHDLPCYLLASRRTRILIYRLVPGT